MDDKLLWLSDEPLSSRWWRANPYLAQLPMSSMPTLAVISSFGIRLWALSM